MHPVELERVVAAELRHLGVPRAPHTLLPRVMAAVQQWASRPWYAREWLTWPVGLQVVSVAALVLLASGSVMVLPDVRAALAGPISALVSDVAPGVTGMAQRADATMQVAQILWRTLIEPFVFYVFAVAMLMCLACAAFGAALNHVVFGRPHRV